MAITSEIKNHALHARLEVYRKAIAGIPKDHIDFIKRKRRIEALYDFLATNIEKSEPNYIPDQVLDIVQTNCEAALAAINSFSTEKNSSQLDTAIDSLSKAVREIPAPFYSRYAKLNNAHLDRFNNRVDEIVEEFLSRLASVSDQASNIETIVGETEARIKELKESAAAFNDSLNTTFQQSQAQRRDEFKTELEGVNDQTTKFIKENSDKLNAKIEEFDGSRTELIEKSNAELKTANDRYHALIEEYQNKKTTFEKKIEDDIQEIVEKRNHIRELYRLTGNDATVGGYQSQADQEKKSADLYRVFAITLMIIAAAALLYPYIMEIVRNERHDFQWAVFLERLPLSTIILVPALYAARESGKHRSEERSLRTLQLQISTLDPYLSTLPDNKKRQIKEDLVGKYFDGRRAERSSRTEQSMLDQVLDELRKITGNFTNRSRGQ
ncbi:hypothetical protein [Hyphobacterium sp.]|uniref:hypothetical protein n=1 Tax=Hyphobacterium sp. TaxID=2004662 RepID=UPI003BA90417